MSEFSQTAVLSTSTPTQGTLLKSKNCRYVDVFSSCGQWQSQSLNLFLDVKNHSPFMNFLTIEEICTTCLQKSYITFSQIKNICTFSIPSAKSY